ncbi:speckle-type POZ protein A [Fopius arisanus]|uniref:Speckle-type POZ protein A n=1 Tax=Fopius arisanus TaxID=64838 RepID=A0A0C9PQI9_9HYME|nr:PREDICTED: speckle-type POZ protein A-like [Fopius arisanus]
MDSFPNSSICSKTIERWCHSEIKKSEINFLWVIDNFTGRVRDFASTIPHDNNTYTIHLIRNMNDTILNYEIYSIRLLAQNIPHSSTLEMIVTIIDRHGKKFETVSFGPSDISRNIDITKRFITLKDLIDNREEWLPNGRLTLCLNLVVHEEYQNIATERSIRSISIPKSNIALVLENVFANKRHCDVKFILGPDGCEISAHKAILAGRSSVFRATFEAQTEESQKNCVNIPDFSPEAFTELLRFIYTDRVQNLHDLAKDLLIMANYYDLERLRIMCEESLRKNLTVQNAPEILLLADLHNANQLKRHAQGYIQKNAKYVVQSTEFQALQETHPKYSFEILTTLVNNLMTVPKSLDMPHLQVQNNFTDITLKMGDETLHAHKVILAANSPVFEHILLHNTGITNHVLSIKDIEAPVMLEILKYMYTGQLSEIYDTDTLVKILSATKTYEITDLKTICASRLEKALTTESVVPALIAADNCDEPRLVQKASEFIELNKDSVMSLENFKLLCKEKPEVLFNILNLNI